MNDRDFMIQAYQMAYYSPDPSTQNGAVIVRDGIVLCGSANVFPDGLEDSVSRWKNRELKYILVNHAERRAIALAAKNGIACEGATLYCPLMACSVCAQQIVDSGIKRCVFDERFRTLMPKRWSVEVDRGMSILREAGIERTSLNEVFGLRSIHFNGQSFIP